VTGSGSTVFWLRRIVAETGRQRAFTSSGRARRVAIVHEEVQMALARVVSFDGVSAGRMEEMRREMSGGERPDDVPATEIVVLHDPEAERSLVILFFDNEDDYKRGDAALNAMSADDTPGQRTSVGRYDVAMRMTA
jgi:hypothetical protein